MKRCIFDAGAESARISPTAHYTGYIWQRNGLSIPALATRRGRLLYHAFQPILRVLLARGGAGLEAMLLARHRGIDDLLASAIERGEVRQVIEIAAGMSPRGHRMMRRYGAGQLVYVEADLPAMVAMKERALAAAGPRAPGHHIVELDALRDTGPHSLSAVGARLLEPGAGTAVITEGLLSYFEPAQLQALWQRVASFLVGFPHGLYLSDLHLSGDIRDVVGSRGFQRLLSMFVRGQVHIHFRTPADAERALLAAGFARAHLHPAGQGSEDIPLVRVIEASTAQATPA